MSKKIIMLFCVFALFISLACTKDKSVAPTYSKGLILLKLKNEKGAYCITPSTNRFRPLCDRIKFGVHFESISAMIGYIRKIANRNPKEELALFVLENETNKNEDCEIDLFSDKELNLISQQKNVTVTFTKLLD